MIGSPINASLAASRRQMAAHYVREVELEARRERRKCAEAEVALARAEAALAAAPAIEAAAQAAAKVALARAEAAAVAKRCHEAPRGTMDEIISAVADHFAVPVAAILSPSRCKRVIRPRQIAMYLASNGQDSRTHTRIGDKFGREHTTVWHAVHTIGARRLVDCDLEADVVAISAKLDP